MAVKTAAGLLFLSVLILGCVQTASPANPTLIPTLPASSSPFATPVSSSTPTPDSGPTMCYQIYAPVCGTDGKTYPNDCYAKNAGVGIAYDGSCSGIPLFPSVTPSATSEPGVCYEIYAPVCGANGKTYANDCFARKDGTTVTREGFCEESPTPSPVPSFRPTACPEVMDPVCGTNGRTYSNSCFARAAGVPIAHYGAC